MFDLQLFCWKHVWQRQLCTGGFGEQATKFRLCVRLVWWAHQRPDNPGLEHECLAPGSSTSHWHSASSSGKAANRGGFSGLLQRRFPLEPMLVFPLICAGSMI